MTTVVQQTELSHTSTNSSYNVDKVVQSVTNASKRLSQISTNTSNSNKKRKSQNRIGPWKLGRTLGRGSTGRVRLAKNINTGKLAAIKIVPKSNFKKLENPKYKNLSGNLPYGIEREIIIMKLINHPNIMGLYDVWENKNDLYLILEYIEGGELFDYLIKRGKLQEYEAINYFKQIINGISYLHQFNICHRDLKPENLLLDFNKNIKIADFGMAALEVNEKLLETSCGSPHYASPEIVAGKNYHGAPSDIWSCGIILFALLTGHLPFDDENIRKLLLKVQSGKFVMPSSLSGEAKDLISKMLKVNPDDRILIKDILQHPLLTKYPNPKNFYNAVDLNNLHIKPIDNFNRIDKEIMKNLCILFHNCDEDTIVSKLLSPKSNPEKVFYFLLMKYRNDHIDDNVDDFSIHNDGSAKDNSPTRITKSASSKKILSNITNVKNSNSFKASSSFNKKKPMKLNDNITISRTSSKSHLRSAKSSKKLARKLTGDDLNKFINFDKSYNFDKTTSNIEKEYKPAPKPTQTRKLSKMAEHERKLAEKVHKANEARALKYAEEEEERKARALQQLKEIEEQQAKKQEEEAEKQRVQEEQASDLKRRQKEALRRLLIYQSQLTLSGTDSKNSPKKRNATEPPMQSSLDPRIAGINSLLRAKSIAAPSSYASLRQHGITENTSKVLQKLGIELNQPPRSTEKFKATIKTSSSKRLSDYITQPNVTDKENLSIDEFNKIEQATPTEGVKYKSLLSHIDETSPASDSKKSTQTTGLQQKLKSKPESALPKVPTTSSNKIKTESNTSLMKVSPSKVTTTVASDRVSLLPNPRFSRFSFNGLLAQFDPDTEIYNNVQSSGTVVRKSKSQLKKSSTINLKGLGIGKDEFISVAMSENDETTNNYSTLIKNAISDDEYEQGNFTNSFDSQSDLISSRTAVIGLINTKRPSLIDERTKDDDDASTLNQQTILDNEENILDNSSLMETLNIEELSNNDNEITQFRSEDDDKEDTEGDTELTDSSLFEQLQQHQSQSDAKQEQKIEETSSRYLSKDSQSIFTTRMPVGASPVAKTVQDTIPDEPLPQTKHQSTPVYATQPPNQLQPTMTHVPIIESKPIEVLPPKPTNNMVFRRFSLKPKRQAPKAPVRQEEEPKENWFMKLIHSLGSNSSSPKNIITLNSNLTSTRLMSLIKGTLELKKIEGTLTNFDIDEEFGLISGAIPSKFANGRKLKFKIEIIDMLDKSSLHIIKEKGSNKAFKNLSKIVQFIISQNEKP